MVPIRKLGRSRQLAGIDGEAAAAQRFVEVLEVEVGIARGEKGLDDRASLVVREQGGEAHVAHALDQLLGIAAIALAAGGNAALLGMFASCA